MMKRLLLFLALASTVLPALAEQLEWLTNLEAVKPKARAEVKFIMLDFTGSDWCNWCMKLKSEVFDKPEFAAFARNNLIAVEVDFPKHKPQSAAQRQANEQLAQTYGIQGYPTIILLDPSGQPAGQLGYLPGGPQAFIAQLSKLMTARTGRPVNAAAVEDEPEAPMAPRKPVEFVPIAPATPINYDALALKGISGPPDRRLALINNQTFEVGETNKVKVKDDRINVVCKEIHDDFVVITANGAQLQLRLSR